MFSTAVPVRTSFTAVAALKGWTTTVVVVALAVCSMTAQLRAESANAALFRIFLSDGTSLVSFGEFARVGDRVVFSVPLGEGSDPRLHLVSIPETTVNWQRTNEYAAA